DPADEDDEGLTRGNEADERGDDEDRLDTRRAAEARVQQRADDEHDDRGPEGVEHPSAVRRQARQQQPAARLRNEGLGPGTHARIPARRRISVPSRIATTRKSPWKNDW